MSNRLQYVAPSAAIPIGVQTVSPFPPLQYGTVPQEWVTLDGVIPEFDLDVFATGAVSVTDAKLYGGMTDVLSFAVINATTAAATDLFTKVGHGLYTGDGPFTIGNSGGALPEGIEAGASYYAIRVDADTFRVALTRAAAGLGEYVDLTTDGSGTQDITEITDITKKILWRLVGVIELNLTLVSTREAFTTRVQHSPRSLYYALTWTGTAANTIVPVISPIEGR